MSVFWSAVPKFPKEIIDPVVVKEGDPFILECNPPKGVGKPIIHWMSISKLRSNWSCLSFICINKLLDTSSDV